MLEPAISIIIPLYNKREKLRRTIQSVLNQSYKEFEIIIIDDGSNDNSLSVIQDICDKRISIYRQIHIGVSRSRNLGIEKARGRFIVFLDADDEWNIDFLLSMMNLADSFPECSLFASNYKFKDNHNRESVAKLRGLKIEGICGVIDNYFKVASKSHPPLCIGNTMIRHHILNDRTFYFNEKVHHGEDLIFWAKLAAKNKIAYTKNILMTYNISSFPPGNESTHIPQKHDCLTQTLLKIKAEYNPQYIYSYIAHCKKMSVATLTRRGLRYQAIIEAITGLKYNPIKWELYLYIFLNMIRISNSRLDAILRKRYMSGSSSL